VKITGTSDLSGTSTWTDDPQQFFSQKCRQDLAQLFSQSVWDGWLGNKIRNSPDSCRSSAEGYAEMQVFWHSRILEDYATQVFAPAQPGTIGVDWAPIGASSYEAAFGSGNHSFSGWTTIPNLEGLYIQYRSEFRSGPLLMAAYRLDQAARFSMLSFINAALTEREDAAFTRFRGQLSSTATYTWMLLRQLREDVEGLIPGLKPEGEPAEDLQMASMDTQLNSNLQRVAVRTGRTLSQTAIVGFLEVPLTDNRGNSRNLICGAGERRVAAGLGVRGTGQQARFEFEISNP